MLHARAIASGWSARPCSQYLGVVEISERAIVEKLMFDRKLQEANVDRSEGDGELQASRPRWLDRSERPQIQ